MVLSHTPNYTHRQRYRVEIKLDRCQGLSLWPRMGRYPAHGLRNPNIIVAFQGQFGLACFVEGLRKAGLLNEGAPRDPLGERDLLGLIRREANRSGGSIVALRQGED